ncbi:taurine dioxygenase [[Emmonsia] crescens]|uniref:Taurine dioxygenase n=1 Tax=[Emmonsia] crescens TaxID=73230 RepID=A0A0G2J9Q6_9EURO|nr:taurine dioxygenase [Emmonsia crescens UAMH 3008]
MAPFVEEPLPLQLREEALNSQEQALHYEPGRTVVEDHENYPYDYLLPSFPDIRWDPIEKVPYHDKGILGDEKFSNLLNAATDIFDYNPKIGTEIRGVNLAKLTDDQKNDLARLIATRGVVFFRGQDDFDIEAQRDLGRYFGTLHRHATTAVPKRAELEDIHVVYTGDNSVDQRALFSPSFLWHSDVTYEVQPPSYTSLKVLTGPPRGGGGDTLWSSQYAAYDALSTHMQRYLKGLTALHSADMQAKGSEAAGRPIRREPITTQHPLIRTNPVTGWNSLFFNPGFVTTIVGVPKLESDAIISYLNDVVATTQELHARFQWRKNDVAFWDNRSTNHTASYGFAPHRRHAVRVACHAERPTYDPSGRSQEEYLAAKYNLPLVNKDGSLQSNYND